MEKIALMEVNGELSSFGSYCRHSILDPIAVEYIGSVAKANGYNVEINHNRSFFKKGIFKGNNEYNPNILGFSVNTYNFEVARRLAREIKSNNSKIITVFGGYHPSAMPQIVEDEYIDFVVIGEGEITFIELLDALDSNNDIKSVNGIAYWDGSLRVNKPRERLLNLDELPFPLREERIIKKCKIGGLSYPSPSIQKSVCQITYSRGCSYNCKFCSSPQLWGKKVLWRSAKNLVGEIEYLQQEFDTNMLFFTDLSFNLNRMNIFELCNEIINRKIKINWFSMCCINNMDKDLIIAMKEAGCTKISFGIDSLNNGTLSRIKPNQRVKLNKIKSTLELTSNTGIIVRAYVMIGYPWEDKKSLNQTKELLKTLPIDDLRISFLTPFPGTPIYEEFKKENLLLTEDFSRYTSEEPVVKIEGIPPEMLIEVREKIFKDFYQSKEYEIRMKEKLKKFPYLKQSYDEFFDFLHTHAVFS